MCAKIAQREVQQNVSIVLLGKLLMVVAAPTDSNILLVQLFFHFLPAFTANVSGFP